MGLNNKNKHMKKTILIFALIFSFINTNSQTNQFDSDNKRHGKWIKHYENGNIRYQGVFKNGKETGVFKYYDLASPKQPIIIKTFNKIDNTASVRFFTATGKLLSEGKMNGKNRIGKWNYFQKDGKSIMQEEHYLNGKLDGKYTTYFENKKPTIEANYKDGLLEGAYKRYSVRGHVYQDLHYKNGVLDGAVVYHDRLSGDLVKKGLYKNDVKTGVWEYYFEGELIEKVDMDKELSQKK